MPLPDPSRNVHPVWKYVPDEVKKMKPSKGGKFLDPGSFVWSVLLEDTWLPPGIFLEMFEVFAGIPHEVIMRAGRRRWSGLSRSYIYRYISVYRLIYQYISVQMGKVRTKSRAL